MSGFTVSEVNEPILNSPFEKPTRYWYIKEGEAPILADGRRPSFVFPPRDQKEPWKTDEKLLRPSKEYPSGYELILVNLVRERVECVEVSGLSRRQPHDSGTDPMVDARWQREAAVLRPD